MLRALYKNENFSSTAGMDTFNLATLGSTATPLNESFLWTQLQQLLWLTIANTSRLTLKLTRDIKHLCKQNRLIFLTYNSFIGIVLKAKLQKIKIQFSKYINLLHYCRWYFTEAAVLLGLHKSAKHALCKLRKTHRGDILNLTKLTNSVNHWAHKFVIQTCKNTRAQLIKVFPLWPNPALLEHLLLMLHTLFKDKKCSSTAGMNILNFATLVFTQAQQLWVLI